MSTLPDYVVIEDERTPAQSVLRLFAEAVGFPLSDSDRHSIEQLRAVFESEEPQGAGLAAPQIGISKCLIIFQVLEEYKTFRKDVTETFPTTVWINPKYEPIGAQKAIDWEACFSVRETMAEVPRYTSIHYSAQTLSGEKVEGTATGFLARLLQHEIGHLNGELFTDLIVAGCRSGSIAEMRALREKERNPSI